MRTSTTKHAVLTAGGTASAVILDGPGVLTTVIVQENSGTAYAIVELRVHGAATKIMVLCGAGRRERRLDQRGGARLGS